jgi:triphosphatase
MSNSELEVKFCTLEPATHLWRDEAKHALKVAGFSYEELPEKVLSNTYFDTPDQVFEKQKMGVRVRGCNGKYEQTLKTQKSVSGGLHERLEFNVPLESDTPDPVLFPKEAWPNDLECRPEDMLLEPQFSTFFTRHTINLSHPKGGCELVFDEGEVSTENSTKAINEIELELVSGDVSVLIEAAEALNTEGLRLSDVSKAAQGYTLLSGVKAKIKTLPVCLSLPAAVTTERVFVQSCQTALEHWQYHEHLYFESSSPKLLPEIATGIRLLLQSLALFLPVLQCEPLLRLQRDVLTFSEKWLWVDELQSTRFLLSKKGPFFKTIAKQTGLVSYLQGRQAGQLKAFEPEVLLTSKTANSIKLRLMTLLLNKPWRSQTVMSDMPVIEHAKGWLSQGWQTLHQTMQSSHPLSANHYSSVETLMRQTLYNGFMLSDLFPESGPARAPWLDLLLGIEEVRALQLLEKAVKEAELEFDPQLASWVNDKLTHLLQIMERTRNVAMSKSTYW